MSKPHGGASTPPYTFLSVTPAHHDFAPVLQVGMISHERMWHFTEWSCQIRTSLC